MQNEPIDLLQIKIDRARENLPPETRKAIDAVDWKAVILGFREKKGFSFEQLEDLELETELLLCGLISPAEYPKNLQKELNIPKAQVDLLLSEINELVFKKIREILEKNTEKKELFVKKEGGESITNGKLGITNEEIGTLNKEGINVPNLNEKELPAPQSQSERVEFPSTPARTDTSPPAKGETGGGQPSFMDQKLSDSFKMPPAKTEYSLNNLSKASDVKASREDPYRMDPNE
jgi:hypothetical protein